MATAEHSPKHRALLNRGPTGHVPFAAPPLVLAGLCLPADSGLVGCSLPALRIHLNALPAS